MVNLSEQFFLGLYKGIVQSDLLKCKHWPGSRKILQIIYVVCNHVINAVLTLSSKPENLIIINCYD